MKQQKLLATIFSSIILAMAPIKLFEGVGHRINPGISKLERSDMQSILDYWSELPNISMVFMLFAHFLGMIAVVLIASYMCKQLGVEKNKLAIRISSGVIFLYIVISLFRLPHPMVMNVLDPVMGLLGYIVGVVFSKRMVEW
jgi:hypothetical protein